MTEEDKVGTTRKTTAAIFALATAFATEFASAGIIFKEAFDGAAVPPGWIMNGRENSPNSGPHTGTAKTDKDWFLNDPTGSFLRLTESGPQQRTTATYRGSLFRTDQDFAIRMDLRMSGKKNNADGLNLFWLDSASVLDIGTTIGGSGEWHGTPRGDETGTPQSMNETKSYGWYPKLRGYAFEFDHYSNDPTEPAEHTSLVDLRDWSHIDGTLEDFSADPAFYLGNGWQTVEFGYHAAGDHFTLSWGYDGSSFTNTKKYSAAGTDKFASAYFGLGAGTHGLHSDQDVRNVVLWGAPSGTGPAPVPEPGTWAAAVLLMAGAVILRWRSERTA